jgi:LysM repeat protein
MINELIIAGASFFHPHAPIDSIGVETVNGKVFVIHRVDEKETLYAIARRYGATVDAIRTSNPGLVTTLEVGQILKVPYTIRIQPKQQSAANTHKVAPKETMYSISRAYGVSVDDIRKWNNLTDNNLSVGQELVIMKPSSQQTAEPVKSLSAEKVIPTPPNGLHTVMTKETMYSIARQYGISVSQIRSWNSLPGDELQVGQSIYVAAPPANTPTTVSAQEKTSQNVNTTPSSSEPKTTQTQPKIDENQPKQNDNVPPRTDQTASSSTKHKTIRISESLKNSDEITEDGIAELIEGTEGNRKYLALHRTAPVGTILKVRNEMNNRDVFVRVMGILPDTAMNDKLVIKISRSAYDRLGAIDPRFRVELTYYK